MEHVLVGLLCASALCTFPSDHGMSRRPN